MGYYILNKETQKLELHFEKSEYIALSDEQKREIKSTFLWSGKANAWVSRSINSHWRAEDVAKKLGLENAGSVGERLSYVEELERKSERAEARAERFEQYSENAEKRAVNLQAEFNKYRKDWSWLTQPIIAGHRGSQAFANHRNKVMARYDKGFEEYQKSDYYQQRAATARATADNAKLKDLVYLHNRIKECNKNLKGHQKNVIRLEEMLFRIQQGEQVKNYSGVIYTEEYIEQLISDCLEKYEWENDKLEFFEKCVSDLGGIQFSKETIKAGYIVNINNASRKCEILSAGPVNVTYRILEGGAAGMVLTAPYAAINSIVEERKIKDKIDNPFKVGEILCKYRPAANDSIYQAYQVIKVTETGVKIQQIAVENNIPIPGKFTGEAAKQKKVTKSKWSDFVGVYDNDWQLNKYSPKESVAS